MFWERVNEFVKWASEYKWFIFACVVVLGFAIGIIDLIRKNKEKDEKVQSRNEQIRDMVTVAIFASMSVLFYLTFKFSIPIFPEFLKLNFSNLPVILGAFLLGRKGGVMIVLIRTIIVLPFSGTFFVGELADLIISLAIVLVGTYIYKKNKTKKGAIISLVAIFTTWVLVSLFANYVILIPAYVELMFGGEEEVFVSLLGIIPNVTVENYKWKYLLLGALPFNVVISTLVCFITFITYKKLSILFHKFDDEDSEKLS